MFFNKNLFRNSISADLFNISFPSFFIWLIIFLLFCLFLFYFILDTPPPNGLNGTTDGEDEDSLSELNILPGKSFFFTNRKFKNCKNLKIIAKTRCFLK